MTRILVLGAGGMLGHKLMQRSARSHETVGAVRVASDLLVRIAKTAGAELAEGVDVTEPATVARVIGKVRPTVVVNCVGVIKQKPGARNAIQTIAINALFPHQLAEMCADAGARLIQLGTDCVFSGEKGMYSESDRPDPVDTYGRSKLLGEIQSAGALTMRTSMVGRELSGFHSLVEWFLHQPAGSTVKGYQRAIFSGLPTPALADEIVRVIEHFPTLEGMYHVSVDPISKFDLLTLVRDVFGVRVTIEPETAYHCDRSLVSDRYRAATGFVPASWERLVQDMAADIATYAAR